MRTFKIVQYPHPMLRKVASPVAVFDRKLASVARRMIATMYGNKGVGLAGPQVGLAERILVFDASDERDQPQVVINPEIVRSEGSQISEEGCLSIPDVRVSVPRAAAVVVRAQDVAGRFFRLDAAGLRAVVLQHEIDHLNGILIVDYLPQGVDLAMATEKPSRLATR
ncbi:MAG: peptide deformylase [Acidobacteria bacterium]|nr:peptide deformylase [Acidobacteriota bacterium]